MKRTPNEIFTSHRSVDIFHVYQPSGKNSHDHGFRREFWYSTDERGSDTGTAAFDVREVAFEILSSTGVRIDGEDSSRHKEIICLGIEAGLIKIRKDD
jgi:hypothetical protein